MNRSKIIDLIVEAEQEIKDFERTSNKTTLKLIDTLKTLINYNIRDSVYNFKTKNKEGFVKSEVETLLKDYANINMDKFNDALRCNTCIVRDNETILYHCDVENALRCGIENRNLNINEFD